MEQRRVAVAASDKRHNALGFLRMLTVAAALAMTYAALWRGALSGWWLLVPVAVFVELGVLLQRVVNEHSRLSRGIAFYERSLARLDGRWAGTGESGARFLEEQHLYAQDLDLFGSGSLFEMLSSARTGMGEETLAGWLLAPAPPETVRARHQAVVELAPRLDLREDFAVLGESVRACVDPKRLAAWGEREPVLQSYGLRLAAWALTFVGATTIAVLAALMASWPGLLKVPEVARNGLPAYLLLIFFLFVAVHWRLRKHTARIIDEVEQALRDLDVLAGVLNRLEAERFSSPRLALLRADLDTQGTPPSRRIARLKLLMDLLDSRRDAIFGLIAPLLMWEIHLCYAFEDWRRISGPALGRWLNVVGEIEALASLGGYSYEHPRDVFPEFVAESPCFEAEALCHPLLAAGVVVPNEVRLGGELRVLVVSGSNMSGKSTLLRTIGVNAVLAQAGAPVRARRLRLSPLAVGSSIRIQDSLQAGASRFYAEITRLRQIMEKTGDPLPVLFLIDEFLHGTNSHDRRIGAEAIVRGLVERGAIGLVTTHDLALAHIADSLAPRGANVHFEDYLEDGRMRFDYKMRPGVVQKSNAIELMRSVGLEV
jgi:MutS domain V